MKIGLNEIMLNYIKVVVVSVLMFLSTHISAQSVAQNVLDEIVISSSGYTGIVKVIFRIPVRYISHDPLEVGNEVRIKIDFINANLNRRAAAQVVESALRESLVPKYKDSFGLEEVSYERVLNDNYVTLYFNKNVSFEIIQDSDYRSLSIIIHDRK